MLHFTSLDSAKRWSVRNATVLIAEISQTTAGFEISQVPGRPLLLPELEGISAFISFHTRRK